jgi:hypothetical protein
VDLALTGFAHDEVAKLLKQLESREKRNQVEHFDLEAALEEATREPRSKPGDLWLCGDHRILCGDATKGEDVDRLLGDRRPKLAFTDPPYNVNLWRPRRPAARHPASAASPTTPWTQWPGRRSVGPGRLPERRRGRRPVHLHVEPRVGDGLADPGREPRSLVRHHHLGQGPLHLGRADYQRGYEPIWYGWREGVDHYYCGDRDQSGVWTISRPSESAAHPTMKPLALIERAIEHSSQVGDVVLDLFLGSGSTLIAAERTGRVCFGMELDPRYTDIAVARWEQFSGERAVRETAGENARG